MKWLKYTRENLLEFIEKIKTIENNEGEMNKLKNTTTYDLYMNNKIEIEKWLELPENQINTSLEDCRKNCH